MTSGFCWISAGSALGDLAAEVEHHDVLRDAHHQPHVVLDEQDRQVVARADVGDHRREFVDLGVGEARRRFVQHQQFGSPDQTARASSIRFSVP